MISIYKTSRVINSHSIKTVHRKNNFIIKASKTPKEIKELIKKELDKANEVCCDINRSDVDCMLQWDIVDDLSIAYRKAVEEEKGKQHLLNEEKDKDFIWDTRKKTFDL